MLKGEKREFIFMPGDLIKAPILWGRDHVGLVIRSTPKACNILRTLTNGRTFIENINYASSDIYFMCLVTRIEDVEG